MIEEQFDVSLISKQARHEKQSQRTYRPVTGVHKWFARRAGSVFRGLLLAEFGNGEDLATMLFRSNTLENLLVADPFMGGGTPIFEAIRVGCNVVGCDVNPVAYWVVRQAIAKTDREALADAAEDVVRAVEKETGSFYKTTCAQCGNQEANVKYFFWVKQATCETCSQTFDLCRDYLVAKNQRHPRYVFHCPNCKELIESPTKLAGESFTCPECGGSIPQQGPARRRYYSCPYCAHKGGYPELTVTGAPPQHRLYGIEYYCSECSRNTSGRLFKTPTEEDLLRYSEASRGLSEAQHLVDILPSLTVLEGVETDRLLKWGYKNFRQLFNDRQLLTLGNLARSILATKEVPLRHALATVFSDIVRYHNVLCQYDSYALKGRDVFAVHSFPVPLTYCESNVLGLPGVGSGGFRNFLSKFDRAKAYCQNPFETRWARDGTKESVPTSKERVVADIVQSPPDEAGKRQAFLAACTVGKVELAENSLDAVFTDPPYYDNVQYSELTDLHYAWLERLLSSEIQAFEADSSRSPDELRVNGTDENDIESFASGLSHVYCHLTDALKAGAPFAFTYHHSSSEAYLPLIVAILDAGLDCTATFPYPAEMTSSLHIRGTDAPRVDTVFICRKPPCESTTISEEPELDHLLRRDREWLSEAGFAPSAADLTCLAYGHVVRLAVREMSPEWRPSTRTVERLERARRAFATLFDEESISEVVEMLAA